MKLGLPSFLTFASAFLYHMYLQWGQHPFSIMEATRHFQPGKGPSRGLLCDCEIFGYLRITFVSSSNRYIVTGQTILHYCARKINYFARQLTIVVERIVSGKAVKQQANTIVPLINWVAGAAAGRSYAYIIKTVMVTSVLTWNHCSLPMFPLCLIQTTHFQSHLQFCLDYFRKHQMHSWKWSCMGPGLDWASPPATSWSSSASWCRSPPGSHPPPPTGKPNYSSLSNSSTITLK